MSKFETILRLLPVLLKTVLIPLFSHAYGMPLNRPFLSTISYPLFSKNSWIIDSGTTHHIYCDSSLLSELKLVEPITMTLPNGESVQVTQTRIVTMLSSLILREVLYIPCFAFNLLSISSLASNIPCSVNFSSHSCLIHE